MAYKRICCPKCSDSFGQEARFIDHLTEAHGVSDTSQLYVDMFCNGNWPTCQCSVDCHEKIKFASWKVGFISKYVRGHNAKVDSIYLNADKQKEFAQKRRIGYAAGDYKVWNTGLTKDTSPKIAKISNQISISLKQGYSEGKIVDWHKISPAKAASAAQKMSQTKKQRFASGQIVAWNKGLTKFDDSRVAAMSAGIKENYELNPDASAKRLSAQELLDRVLSIGGFKLLSDPNLYRNKYQKLQFKCNACGSQQIKNLMMLECSPVCFSCSPRESKAQIEIYEFVKLLAPDAILSDRTVISPKELDIWIPSSQLGIEYNGLFWHSEHVLVDKNYHQKKLMLCKKANVRLLSIYEDEWRDKKTIIEGMIRHRLGRSIKVWNARKLKIVELTSLEARRFFDENHLEGHVKSLVSFALKDETTGTLLAALSLRRPFHRKYDGMLEVGRCCTLAGNSVRGWLGKLTKVAKNYAKLKGIDMLMTYVDSRVGSGSAYAQSGWTLEDHDTSPRFWWTDYRHRFNRFKYKANRKDGLSQAEIASAAGVAAIWGCSNHLLTLKVL